MAALTQEGPDDTHSEGMESLVTIGEYAGTSCDIPIPEPTPSVQSRMEERVICSMGDESLGLDSIDMISGDNISSNLAPYVEMRGGVELLSSEGEHDLSNMQDTSLLQWIETNMKPNERGDLKLNNFFAEYEQSESIAQMDQ